MLIVGIPLYNGRATLRDTLNSLCAQTKKNFLVCICDDCSSDPCDDIIEEYQKKLRIKYIKNEENSGPGIARQHILDTVYEMKPMPDYITFCDADDILYPRALDLLYSEARKNSADIVTGKIFCEFSDKHCGYEIEPSQSLTWLHGKMYNVEFLKKLKVRFLQDLRYNEDSYWNLVVNLQTQNKLLVNEAVYLWRSNSSSITRGEENFKLKYNYMYFYAQVCGARDLLQTEARNRLAATFCNIYRAYQRLILIDKEKLEWADKLLFDLFSMPEIDELFTEDEFMEQICHSLIQSEIVNDCLLFFRETFSDWCKKFNYSLTNGRIK